MESLKSLYLVMLLTGLLAGAKAFGFEVEVSTDSSLSDLGSSERRELKAGTKTNIGEKNPLWITAAGRIPVLVIPLSAQGSVIKVESPLVEQAFKDERDPKIDEALSEVTLYLTDIHRLIAKRDLVQAQQKISELKAKYPEVRFLHFIDASIAFLSGDRERSQSLVTLGLSAHPNYQPGLELKRKLEGETQE